MTVWKVYEVYAQPLKARQCIAQFDNEHDAIAFAADKTYREQYREFNQSKFVFEKEISEPVPTVNVLA